MEWSTFWQVFVLVAWAALWTAIIKGVKKGGTS
jgi:hypothetical protein